MIGAIEAKYQKKRYLCPEFEVYKERAVRA
jgi:hypothetical protein